MFIIYFFRIDEQHMKAAGSYLHYRFIEQRSFNADEYLAACKQVVKKNSNKKDQPNWGGCQIP